MGSFLLRLLGHKATHAVVKHHAKKSGALNAKLGFALFKDPRIPISSKLLALSIGVTLTGLLLAIEVPLELILALFVPFVGGGLDLVIDGAEIILFPMLIACLVLPGIARKKVYVRQNTPPYRGEAIDMPPPMLD